MASVLGWIAGICLVIFTGIGMWMAAPVAWTSFRPPSDRERDTFTARRERIPFGPWFGCGLVGVVAAIVALAVR